MGAQQSSPNASLGTRTCYYEILGVSNQATDEEIKKSYRRKALECHPDRNFGDTESATARFAEIQSAYDVLSNPQERAWYDSHRDAILLGQDVAATDDYYENNVRLTSAGDILNLMSKFNARTPFTDEPNGFFGILKELFSTLALEEDSACRRHGLEPFNYATFGDRNSDYETVVKPFYRAWMGFSTSRSFSWKDTYRSTDAPDRATRRVMDRENRRLRDEAVKDFNDAVRTLTAFSRKRDPRYIPNSLTDEDRQKFLRDAAAAQATRSRMANIAKLNEHIVPEWAQTTAIDETYSSSESEPSEIEQIECVVCRKYFKSQKQYEAHEKSKKHFKAVQFLQKKMRKENKAFNLEETKGISQFLSEDSEISRSSKGSVVDFDPNDAIANETPERSISNRKGDETTQQAHDLSPHTDGSNYHNIPVLESLNTTNERPVREIVQTKKSSLNSVEVMEEPPPDPPTPLLVTKENETGMPRLGKAKAKRAKKAKRQGEIQSKDQLFECATCHITFESNNQLFNHLKESNHAKSPAKFLSKQ